MNVVKRAIISMKKNLGKAIVLFILLFILGNLISGAISIRQAIIQTEANLQARLPAVATIEEDNDAWMAYHAEHEYTPPFFPPSSDTINQIGNLPYVRHFNFSLPHTVYARELVWYWNPQPSPDSPWQAEDMRPLNLSYDLDANVEMFWARGTNSPHMTELAEDIISLVEGRVFTQEELDTGMPVALVSTQFATVNNLMIGSTITIENNVYDWWGFDIEMGPFPTETIFQDRFLFASEAYEIEIIGLFEVLLEFDLDGEQGWFEASEEGLFNNRIYLPNALINTMRTFDFEKFAILREQHLGDRDTLDELLADEFVGNQNLQLTFVLYNPRDLETFSQTANEILPDFWRILFLSRNFNDIATSMDTVLAMADAVLYVSIGATIAILSLLIMLFLRDRRHEIGIYLALGEAKGKILSQIILEVLPLSLLAMSLSIFTGHLIAQDMSLTFIENDLIAQANAVDPYNWSHIPTTLDWFDEGVMSIEEMLDAYDVSLDANTIMIFYATGSSVILLATIIPIAYTMKLDPKKILLLSS